MKLHKLVPLSVFVSQFLICFAVHGAYPLVDWAGCSTRPMTGTGWTLDGQPVTVPHTWCAGQPEGGYQRRCGTYRRALPNPTAGKRQFVRFEGVSIKAVVRVNGKEVGRHAGPVTPFTLEISSALEPSGNTLEVEADNRVDRDVPPMSGDFPLMGGIYRNCWFIETPQSAEFDRGFFKEELAPPPPRQHVEFRPDGLYLDGKRTVLRGVNYHQDGPDGWVLSPEQEERDLRLIKAMGANAVRTCHYPRSAHFYDLCDRLGLYVWTELPLVWEVNPTPAFRENALAAAREMVLAHRHHPCILTWGVYNELNNPNFYRGVGKVNPTPVAVENEVVAAAAKLIRELDPTRPTTGATCFMRAKELNALTDLVGFNTYPGWYVGGAQSVGDIIQDFCRRNRRSLIALSEYGAGACIDQHRNPRAVGDHPNPSGKFHPEEYQARVHEDVLRGINASTNLWGVFVWQMFDSYSTLFKQGSRDGINDKGLVTRDRKACKDSYYFYKANWNPEPMLHLCGRRLVRTKTPAFDVYGYCNCADRVELRVNGAKAGTQSPDSVKTVAWPKVPLKAGCNTIELVAGDRRASTVVMVEAPGAAKPDRVAMDALNYRFTVCGTPIEFADRKIDWNANPTYNNYCEWPWQFARHWFLRNLAAYYEASGDETAARTWVDIVTSFIDNAPPPPPRTWHGATKSWRTLDTGLRASVWAASFPKVEKSPAVTPEFREKFFKSVRAHAARLIPQKATNNWRLMELHGLLDLALAFPSLPEAAAWRKQAEEELSAQIARQIYPDGFQFELTSGYHGIVHETFAPLCARYQELGLTVPAGFTNNLEKAYGLYVKLVRPDGCLPAINDGGYTRIAGILKRAHEIFPARSDFLWGATRGQEGRAPDFLSLALPYSGAVVFRNTWRPDAVWGYVDMSPWGYSHQHEDKLNFVLFAYGKSMLAEGGTFHYDASEMRRYVLSTRSHNTIRIDGKDQCARASWKWREEMLNEKAPLEFSTTAARDVAKATFDLGYGTPKKLDRSVAHTRTVEFIKDAPEGPYFRITDELVSSDDREHAYEQLWHLEECDFTMEERAFAADFKEAKLKATFACEGTDGRLVDQIGQTKPVYQGWLPKGSQATRVHRPVHTPTLVGTFKGRAKIVVEFRPARRK